MSEQGAMGVSAYLDSLDPGNRPLLEEVRQEAVLGAVPVLRRETERLLKTLLVLKRPSFVLELGTAVGYSALVMRDTLPEASHITTVESWAPRIAAARRNFSRAGCVAGITLLEGDAGVLLPTLPREKFDFVFMDAAKGQYLNWLPHLLNCMRPGAVLLSDNVLQEGSLVLSRFAVDRRDRTIHTRMREYLYTLTHTPALETSVLPCGDGVALTVKKQEDL